jgi:hypothetical protein
MPEYREQAAAATETKSHIRTRSIYFEYPHDAPFSILQRRDLLHTYSDGSLRADFHDEFIVRPPESMQETFVLRNPQTNDPLPGSPTMTYQDLLVALFSFGWHTMEQHDALPAGE